MIDPIELGKAMGAIVKEAVAPLVRRIEELEAAALPGITAQAIIDELLAADGMKTIVDLYVAEHFETNPIPAGPSGPAGEKGADGADGVGLAGAVINRAGELVVTKTNGEAVTLGQVIGKDGDPGRDGKDGADFTNVELEYDGERSLIVRAQGAEIVKRLPIPIDRGYWREGMKAEKGDILTQGGSAWIALKDTATEPNLQNADDWRIFARKGRDGAQGPAGREYKAPEPVKLG